MSMRLFAKLALTGLVVAGLAATPITASTTSGAADPGLAVTAATGSLDEAPRQAKKERPNIRIKIKGLPKSAKAKVRFKGPKPKKKGRFNKRVAKTKAFKKMRPGRYAVIAKPMGQYRPKKARTRFKITKKRTKRIVITVNYRRTTPPAPPKPPTPKPRWTQVATGALHSCGLRSDGSAWCWGLNSSGQLGNGTTTASPAPVRVGTHTDWIQISAGLIHTCGLRAGGTAWCWGGNSYGQLGQTVGIQSNVPVEVFSTSGWTQISAGTYHSCGVRDTGTALCWGLNQRGQLGDGTTTDANLPTLVAEHSDWTQVTAGSQHTCGLRSDDSAWCWGANHHGQLGDNSADDAHTPSPVAGPGGWRQLSAGGNYFDFDPINLDAHTCGVRHDGTAWCWGHNGGGELGTGGTTPSAVPVQVGSHTDWTQVVASRLGSCGVRVGSAWCWGRNTFGQLGDGSTDNSPEPVRVGDADDWIQLDSAGSSYEGFALACGVRGDGSAWCWGHNGLGQLGTGTYVNSTVPVQVREP